MRGHGRGHRANLPMDQRPTCVWKVRALSQRGIRTPAMNGSRAQPMCQGASLISAGFHSQGYQQCPAAVLSEFPIGSRRYLFDLFNRAFEEQAAARRQGRGVGCFPQGVS